MTLIPAIKAAFGTLKRNRMRTLLTVLGMVIGVASVMIVFSAGAGIEKLVVGQVESFGTDFIETEIKMPSNKRTSSNMDASGAQSQLMGAQITSLTLDDMDDITALPNVIDGYSGIIGQEQVSYANEIKKAFLLGTSASYIDIDLSEIEEGRFYTEAEDKSQAKVIVLGSGIKETLFGDSDAIGKSIKIRKTKFRVIGVMAERGVVFTMDFDNYVYTPIRTLQKRIMGIDHVLYMVHSLHDTSIADITADKIRRILRENHDIEGVLENDFSKDDFRVVTMEEMMVTMDVITDALTLLLLAIVVISLVVGGVGVMNIMYVVISERTSEIGLRKAVGAKFKDIMFQFLFEAVLISLLSAVIGIVVGLGISFLISVAAIQANLDWSFIVPIKSFVVAILFSIFTGLVFGLYPARKAAKLDPVEALSGAYKG